MRARAHAVARLQRGGELLDEERHALRPVVHGVRQARRQGAPSTRLGQLPARGGVERRDGELAQHPAAAQVRAQPAQRVAAADLVGAVRGDDQDRQLAQRRGERREQLERRAVRPLQVVEQHERGRERRQRAADRLEHRRAVARGGGWAELGQQHREVLAQRPAAVERRRLAAQAPAQRGHDRPVGRRARRLGGAAQHGRAAQRSLGQVRLARARLPGEQHERATARERVDDGIREPGELALAADERRVLHGRESTGSALGRPLPRRRPGRGARRRCRRSA